MWHRRERERERDSGSDEGGKQVRKDGGRIADEGVYTETKEG